MNEDIFKEVEGFLKSGDIRGVYEKLHSDSEDILQDLSLLSLSISVRRLPKMSEVWPTAQAYSETLLFGMYIAQVFSEITGKE
jgi:hypothetical protein